MGLGGTGLVTGIPGGGSTRGGSIVVFVKISDSYCRAYRLISIMGASELVEDGFCQCSCKVLCFSNCVDSRGWDVHFQARWEPGNGVRNPLSTCLEAPISLYRPASRVPSLTFLVV